MPVQPLTEQSIHRWYLYETRVVPVAALLQAPLTGILIRERMWWIVAINLVAIAFSVFMVATAGARARKRRFVAMMIRQLKAEAERLEAENELLRAEIEMRMTGE